MHMSCVHQLNTLHTIKEQRENRIRTGSERASDYVRSRRTGGLFILLFNSKNSIDIFLFPRPRSVHSFFDYNYHHP